MKRKQEKKLDEQSVAAIREAYAAILNASGYGKITIRIERAGEKRESHFVAVEIEKKTR